MSFIGMTLTESGRNLIASAISEDNPLKITHVQMGDGACNGSFSKKKELSQKVMQIPVKSVKRNDGEVVISCDFNSKEAPRGFYFREVGIIGNGVLCYYDNSGDDAEYIDPDSEAVVKQKRFRIVLKISEEISVQVNVASGLYALKEELDADVQELMEQLNEKADKTGNVSDTTVVFTQASSRTNISAGEKLSTLFGKIAKFFADLKTVAFTGSYNDLANRPSIPAAVRVKGNAESAYKTGDVNITPENIGALPLIGGTITNSLSIVKSEKDVLVYAKRSDTGTQIRFGVGIDGWQHGLWSDKHNKWMIYADNNDIYLNGSADKVDGLDAKSFLGNNTGFIRPNHIGGSTNANDYVTEWHGFVYNMSNLPPGESYGFLDVTWFNGNGFTPAPPENGGVIRQIFTSWSSGRIYVRMRVNNTWKNWRSNSAETIIDTENRNINIIAAYGDGAGYGTQLVIGGGGNVFLGSGVSPSSLYNAFQTASNIKTNESYVKSGENLYITSDNDLWLYVNANTVGNRKGLRFGTSGNIVPVNNSEISLGNSENKFNNAWVNEIYIGTPKTVNTPDGNVEFTSRVNITDSGIGFTMAAYGQPYVTLLNDSSLQVTNIKTYALDVFNVNTSLTPNDNNKNLLGTSYSRWKEIWCSTSLNTASDRNLKKDIKDLASDERYIKFFMMLQPKSYLFKDGESGRTHVGFISQDVEEAMEECGLSSLEFAGFCKDVKMEIKQSDNEWDREEVPVLDEDGNPVYEYSLRYEEFIALNTMMIQRLYEKSESLEQRMSTFEEKMNQLL